MRGVHQLAGLVLICLSMSTSAVLSQDLPEPSPSPTHNPTTLSGSETDVTSSDNADSAAQPEPAQKKEGAFEFFFKYRPMPKWGKAMHAVKGAATAPVHVVSRTFSSWVPAPTYGYNYSQWTPQFPTYPVAPSGAMNAPYQPAAAGYLPDAAARYYPAPPPQAGYAPSQPCYNPGYNNYYRSAPPSYPSAPSYSAPPPAVPRTTYLPPSQPPFSTPPVSGGNSHRFRIQRPNSSQSPESTSPPTSPPEPASLPAEQSGQPKKPLPPGTLDDSVPDPIAIDQPASRETLMQVADCDKQARELDKENRTDDAIAQYQKAFTLDPNPASALIHASAGLLYRKEGHLEEAIAQFKQALAYKPQMPEATIGIAGSFQELGQVSHAIFWLQKYLRENPDAKDAEEVQKNLTALRHADSTWERSDPNATDYFDTVTAVGDYTWPPYKLPIKVYIQIDTDVPGLRPSLAEYLKDALNEWTSATAHRLTWIPWQSKQGADIVVRWRGNHDGDHLTGGEGGITLCQRLKYSNGRHTIEHATITLWTEDISGQKLKSDNDMRNTTFHEVGHALGLMHSPNNKDVMFFSESTTIAPDLTSRDKATIARMYMYYPMAMQW